MSETALLQGFQEACAEQLQNGVHKIAHCVDQLDRQQLWWRPRAEMNSIANILLHLSGNVRQWLIAGISDEADVRDREGEFIDRSLQEPEPILAKLTETVELAISTIEQQTPDDLLRVRHVQEFQITGFQTIQDALCHFGGHVQEIVHMTRFILANNYQFFFVPEYQTSKTPPQSNETQSSLVRAVIDEFERQKRTADAALTDVTDESFFANPAVSSTSAEEEHSKLNSIALIVKHSGGNLVSRWTKFLESDGEKPDRDRDSEFEIREVDSRESIMELWERGWSTLRGSLQSLQDYHLESTITIRGEEHTVYQAIVRALAHSAYHVGQITYLRRYWQPTSKWLTIEPGRSDEYKAGSYLRSQ